MKLRVAGIQMSVTEDVAHNVAAIADAIEQAARSEADILLTPEGALSGWRPDFSAADVTLALAEVTALARERQVGLALGTCFTEPDGLTYNQLRFYHADGTYLGYHSKILRCGSMTDSPDGEIRQYAATELRVFRFGEITIGGLICNDMWANPACTPMPDPHLSQLLANRGARIIFHAVNGGRNGSNWSTGVVWQFHESNLQMRAAAGRVWIVTVDSCTPRTMPCAAPGGVIDPQGQWACRTERQGVQFFVHTIGLPEV